jgi:hypothetical protein
MVNGLAPGCKESPYQRLKEWAVAIGPDIGPKFQAQALGIHVGCRIKGWPFQDRQGAHSVKRLAQHGKGGIVLTTGPGDHPLDQFSLE